MIGIEKFKAQLNSEMTHNGKFEKASDELAALLRNIHVLLFSQNIYEKFLSRWVYQL